MIEFKTITGNTYCYNKDTNRISLKEKSQISQTNSKFLFTPNKSFTTNKITMFTLEMTQQCNLRCKYCCYSGEYRDRRAHNPQTMSEKTIHQVLEFIHKHLDIDAEKFTICFYGGESLLCFNEIKKITSILYETYKNKVRFSISTNGYALSEKIIDWICTYPELFINVTIDGAKEMHNNNRKTITGKGTFDTIAQNLVLFKNKYPKEYDKRIRFLSTVYRWSDVKKINDQWNNYSFLKGHLPVHISHIIPNFKDTIRNYDTYEDKNLFYADALNQYKKGENTIMTSALQKLVAITKHRNISYTKEKQEVITCFNQLFSCFINAEGDIYACEKFCDEFKIGNVSVGFQKEKLVQLTDKFIARKNKHCQSCWAVRMCRMCMTGLNFSDEEMSKLCEMERDSILLSLKYYCEVKEWDNFKEKATAIINILKNK